MTYTNDSHGFNTPVTRYYVDIRPYAPMGATLDLDPPKRNSEELPLIHTLPRAVQDGIRHYFRKPDRFMSLASALLKYLFIHRTAKIPWSEVKIGRTPKPHSRPYWVPPKNWSQRGFQGLEFNVSHQAGVVVLVGCRTPNKPRDYRVNDQDEHSIWSPAVMNPDPNAVTSFESELDEDEHAVRIGVDIACSWEPPRTPDLFTAEKFAEWVEIFGEMFSVQEQWDMIRAPVGELQGMNEWEWKTRRFYTYWALKEAYIKLVGEGLLAPWLKNLEFMNVPVPPRAAGFDGWTNLDDHDTDDFYVLFKDKDITNTIKTTLEGFEDTFLVATMTRGITERRSAVNSWEAIDLFGEIELCATGKCRCIYK